MTAGEKRIVAVFVVLAWLLGLGAGFRVARWKADRGARPESEAVAVDVMCKSDLVLVRNRGIRTQVALELAAGDGGWMTLDSGEEFTLAPPGGGIRSVSVECSR